MKTLLALLFILTAGNSYAWSKRLPHDSCTCVTELQNHLEEKAYDMNLQYRRDYNSFVKIDNDAEFLEGTNTQEAIILIHGFIASPFEVRSVAQKLNDAGYTVYMPLLFGFGAYGEMANNGKLPVWKEQIKAAVKSLSGCYKKITIGGMSLGAALATDYVLSANDPKISSLILMSPYYDISQSVAKTIVGPLSAVKDSAGLSFLYTISRSDDLTEIIKNSKYYSDIMPLNTLQELFKFSDEFKARRADKKSNVPVFLAYSEFDTTISLETANTLPKKHFSNVTVFKMPASLKVPHQIGFESSNPWYRDMTFKIRQFVRKSNAYHTN